MTESTRLSRREDAASGTSPAPDVPQDQGRPMIPVDLLVPHPRNARRDLQLTDEFLAMVAAQGVQEPLRITPLGDGTYLIIEGHRRLEAAKKAGHIKVPYYIAEDRAQDKAGQMLDMVLLNQSGLPLTPLEEAGALFAAAGAGASKTRIRKETGYSKDHVETALKAGRLSENTRRKAETCYDLDLRQLALLHEFDDDPDSVDRLLQDMSMGNSGEHTAARIRRQRAEQAEKEQLIAGLRENGYQVSDDLPAGATGIRALMQDDGELSEQAHASCPGRGVHFPYGPASAVHYCTDPDGNGHASRYPAPASGTDGSDDPSASPAQAPDRGPGQRAVIEGNRAWAAAGDVRRQWLTSLLARNRAPREVALFAARQLLTRPAPVRDKITCAPSLPLFRELAGPVTAAELDAWPAQRLPLLSLAIIATAFEEAMGSDHGKWTWRTDKERFSPCRREEAGTYLRFLASMNYELSAIEKAVADGTPYEGESADQPVPHPGDGAHAEDDIEAEPDEATEQEAASAP